MAPLADIALLSRLAGQRLMGRERGYWVSEVLGEGTQAVVLAAQADDGSPAVVKVFRPSFLRACPRDALLVAQKEHAALSALSARGPCPHVVRLLDVGVVSLDGIDLPWLALERIDGRSLADRVAEAVRSTGHALAPARALRLLGSATEGVRTLHEAGIVHRDVKPSNVLVSGAPPEETACIADLGISSVVGMAPTFAGNPTLGKPGYAAPELSSHPSRGGPAADLFSLGAVAYFALTAEPMFAGSLHAVLAAIHTGVFVPLSGRPALHPSFREAGVIDAIDAVLGRATRSDPRKRHASPQAFWAELGAHIAAAFVWERDRAAPVSTLGARMTRPFSIDHDEDLG